MPYITSEERERLNPYLETLGARVATVGQFNYVLTYLMRAFVEQAGGNYAAHSAAVSGLECAKLEHYRTRTGPYEDEAIRKNGDVRLGRLKLPSSPNETTAGGW